MAGTVGDSFAEAAQKLPELAGLRLAETTVQRTTEATGARLGQWWQAGRTLGAKKDWRWHKDAQGRTCAYISLDATGVPQQAKGGGAAPGRMPWVAMVYNPVPHLPRDHPHRPPPLATMQARYLAGLYDLGLQLRRQAAQVGMQQAEVWIGLTDGGNCLEEFVRRNFAREPVPILDFYHPAEDLMELARLWQDRDEEQALTLARLIHGD